MSDFDCPYCDAPVEVCHDDGFGYSEDELHLMECPSCEREIGFRTFISFSYEPKQVPCSLDGGAHDWKPTRTYPVQFSRMFCKHCEDYRPCTESEMAALQATAPEQEGE